MLGLTQSNVVTTPGVKEETKDMDVKLQYIKVSWHRALVARTKYLAQDRPGIAYDVKELSRGMSSPTVGDAERLKRLGMHAVGKPHVVQEFRYQTWDGGGRCRH